MTISGALARPLLAGIFIYGGLDAVRDPEGKAKLASDVAPMVANALHLPSGDTVMLVRINGGVQVVAGTLLALGKARRLSALALAASLIPTTYAGHRFWEELDDEQRAQQRIQFLKNAAMLGGLVLAAGDTGGRPSVGWRAHRATRHALEAAAAAGALAHETATGVLASTTHGAGHGAQITKAELVDQAHKVAQATRESDLASRALKAAQKAKKANTAEFQKATMKAAHKAAKKAAKKTKKARVGASSAASEAAGQLRGVAGDAWTVVGDHVEPFWESATTAAHEIGDRAHHVLPTASLTGS